MKDPRKAFEQTGLRFTRQRGAVYEALSGVRTHPTAEELHELVGRSESSISLATVYNTLEALSEAGLCRRIPGSGGACRFDADVSEHVHAVLPDGTVVDLPEDAGRRLIESISDELLADLSRRAGVRLDGVGIQLIARSDPGSQSS